MCGIAGYISKNDKPFDIDKIKKMLLDIESRGRDATGIAFISENKKFKIMKAPVMAHEFVTLKEFKENETQIANSRIVLLHARAASNGSPSKNTNNHPIYNRFGVIIHNGIVRYKDTLKADGETDSEQMMLHIQQQGWKSMGKMSGWAAIAYFSFLYGQLYLYRTGSPLFYAQTADVLAFSSYEYSVNSLNLGASRQLEEGTILRIADYTLKEKLLGNIKPKTSYNITYIPAKNGNKKKPTTISEHEDSFNKKEDNVGRPLYTQSFPRECAYDGI
jgi:glucosamine 6-phosphate synthetase-like amidotransferase/phosphosugar isomerase protein